jgi:hypothetical protein
MLSYVRCRFTLGFHRANGKSLSVNTRPFMNDSGDRFALARSRLSSRHGAGVAVAASPLPQFGPLGQLPERDKRDARLLADEPCEDR